MDKKELGQGKAEPKISKKSFLDTLKMTQFENFSDKLTALKIKHKKARKSATLMKSEYFALIKEFMDQEGNILKIQDMCLLADVSRSGYYNWVKSEPNRVVKDERDAEDFALIKEAFNYRGYPKGARSIHMYLLHQENPVLMNVKKIERLMRKFNMKFELKGNGINRKISQMAISGRSAPKFSKLELPEATARRQQFVLMAACHKFPNERVGYFVAIIDTFTKQILAHLTSARDTNDIVKVLLEKLSAREDCKEVKEVLFENGDKFETLKISSLMRSKKSRDYVLDNAFDSDTVAQEHLIGFLRDEINVNSYETSYFGKDAVDDWVDYYNKDRYIWHLDKLSPDEYDEFLQTGKSPLNK
ncbi:MAG: IS3 family transposase [Phascolarctobacterium sp.]|nr:IS3 family transposase [Phascolarctobacterium sp.]